MALKFQIYLTHAGGELLLDKTCFWPAGPPFPAEAPTIMNSVTSGLTSHPIFPWNRGERALCVLLLRSFALKDPTQFRLEGGRRSLAASLHEVLGDKHAKGSPAEPSEPNWIQDMFRGFPTRGAHDPRLSFNLFYHHGNADRGRFCVYLGAAWGAGIFEVFVDGRQVPEPRDRYEIIADELEKGVREDPVNLSVKVLVAPAGSRQLSDFRPVDDSKEPRPVPVRGGQLVRISVKPERPAFLYLFWITPGGVVDLNYPWKPGPCDESRCDELAVEKEERLSFLELPLNGPDGKPKAWPLKETPGLETLVVLSRGETLPSAKRAELLRRLKPKLPPWDHKTRIDPGPYSIDLADAGAAERGLDYRTVTVDDPVQRRHQMVAARFLGHYDTGWCLSFLNAG